MDVTKRFLWFINELDTSLAFDQHLTSELQDYLHKIRGKLNTLNIDAIGAKKSSPAPSMEDFFSFEHVLVESCSQIYNKLKETLDQLCLLHVYSTNFALESSNLVKFLTVYCNAIFGSAKILMIGEHLSSPTDLKRSVSEQTHNKVNDNELMNELKQQLGNEEIKSININTMPVLHRFMKGEEYLGNIAIRIPQENTDNPMYLILHFNHDSPFTGYFIAVKHYTSYPLVLGFIKDIINIAINQSFQYFKNAILKNIETLMVEIIQLQKSYFLSFIVSEVQAVFCSDVPTSLTLVEEDLKSPKRPDQLSKSIDIMLLPFNRLEVRTSFSWDNVRINNKLSAIWGKIQSLSKLQEERTYYRNQLKNVDPIFLQFCKKGHLIYQNGPLPGEYQTFIEINNFLMIPTTRSMNVVLGRNKKFLQTVQKALTEFEDAKPPIWSQTSNFQGMPFYIICKRDEWSKKVEGFSLIFFEIPSPTKRGSLPMENLVNNLEDSDKEKGFKRIQGSFRKMKLFIGNQSLQEASNMLLGQDVDIEKLKDTIISEYLPEELTRTKSGEGLARQSISATKRLVIAMTPKTAFKHLDNGSEKRRSSLQVLAKAAGDHKMKPDKFSKELLVPEKNDSTILNNWSFDILKMEEWTERSRLVWVILNEMNLMNEFKIEPKVLCNFISEVRQGYDDNKNPYHNYGHGISVMHATYYIMRNLPMNFSSLVNLGLLISSFCHDIDHTGRTNNFEVHSKSRLAIRYHDISVLEQHHAAVTFRILNKETCNILAEIQPKDYKELRSLIIENILATDMKGHGDLIKTFRELDNRIKNIKEESYNFGEEDIKVVTRTIIHCADLSGPTKDFPVAYKWSKKVNEEFTKQVKEEEVLGIQVTPWFKDLDKTHIMAKQEIAFISLVIKPLWDLLNDFCAKSMTVATDNINKNIKEWNNLLETATKQMIEGEKKGSQSPKKIEEVTEDAAEGDSGSSDSSEKQNDIEETGKKEGVENELETGIKKEENEAENNKEEESEQK